jgi:hypothetical protein
VVSVAILSSLPLEDRERRILDYLGTVDRSGFNELFIGLQGHASRNNLKTSLDRLIKMRLVHMTKMKRGHRDVYLLKENMDKFVKYSSLLMVEWEVLKQQLRQFGKIVKDDESSPETKVAFLTRLVCQAALITGRVAFIDNEEMPPEMIRGLLKSSLNDFRDLLEATSKLTKYASIVEGFERVSMNMLSDEDGKNVQNAFQRIFAKR